MKTLMIFMAIVFWENSITAQTQHWFRLLTDEYFNSSEYLESLGFPPKPNKVYRDVYLKTVDTNDFPEQVLHEVKQKKLKTFRLDEKKWKLKKEFKSIGVKEYKKDKPHWDLFVNSDISYLMLRFTYNEKSTSCVIPFNKAPIQALQWIRDYSFDASANPWNVFSYSSDSGFILPNPPQKTTQKENVRFRIPIERGIINGINNDITEEAFNTKKNKELFHSWVFPIWASILTEKLTLYSLETQQPRLRSEYWKSIEERLHKKGLDSTQLKQITNNQWIDDFSVGLFDIMTEGNYIYNAGEPKYLIQKIFLLWGDPNQYPDILGYIKVEELPENQRNVIESLLAQNQLYAYLVKVFDKSLLSLEESHAVQNFLLSGEWDKILPQKIFHYTYLKQE